MDANAWVTLFVGIIAALSAIGVVILGFILNGIGTSNTKLAILETKMESVCDDVGSANRKIDAQATLLTSTCTKLDHHAYTCDADRKALHDKIAAVN